MPVDYYPPGGGSDASKVPLAGTASLTGPLGWSSNSGSGTSSAVWIGKDASGPIVNVGSWGNGGGLQVCASNTLNMYLNETYGIVYYVDQTSLSSVHQKIRSSGGFEENVPSGKSYTYKVAGAAVGHWPLTPSDMPTQNELEANASSQTLNSNNYTTIAYDTPGTNTGPAWSYSGGIWTCLIAGKYDIDAIIYVYSSVVVELYINKNGTRRYGGSAAICSSAPYVHRTISFAIGDTMYIESYAAGTGPTLDVSIAGLREIAINRRA